MNFLPFSPHLPLIGADSGISGDRNCLSYGEFGGHKPQQCGWLVVLGSGGSDLRGRSI
jgi:hypothetical protein